MPTQLMGDQFLLYMRMDGTKICIYLDHLDSPKIEFDPMGGSPSTLTHVVLVGEYENINFAGFKPEGD